MIWGTNQPGMTIKLFGVSSDNLFSPEPLDLKSFLFSAGEIQVRVSDIGQYDNILIECRYPTGQEIMEITLIANAINNYDNFDGSITLFLPYLPYSRQDRVCYPGEAFSLDVFASILKTQLRTVDKLVTWDAHSPKSREVFYRSVKYTNVTADTLINKFVKNGLNLNPSLVVVAPDKGAMDRATAVAKTLGAETTIYGEKVRDPNNGNIHGISVKDAEGNDPLLDGREVLIVDDICDGGRTFIELAKTLRTFNPSRITLYVTHGIFSKGFGVFHDGDRLLIDTILTPNIFPGAEVPRTDDLSINLIPTVITLD
jgi:ribose-phosphate pyrophosphokinase